MPNQYPWYSIVNDNSIEQGDFFFSCPVFEPLEPITGEVGSNADIIVKENLYNVIVLSQSCDLAEGKLETVLTCPHWSLSKLDEWGGIFRSREGKEQVRRGNIPGLHMLADCDLPLFSSPVRVVNFRQAFSLPFGYIRALAEQPNPRLRLLPPYREHLAQAFARFIMRVGLPVDIPAFR